MHMITGNIKLIFKEQLSHTINNQQRFIDK